MYTPDVDILNLLKAVYQNYLHFSPIRFHILIFYYPDMKFESGDLNHAAYILEVL